MVAEECSSMLHLEVLQALSSSPGSSGRAQGAIRVPSLSLLQLLRNTQLLKAQGPVGQRAAGQKLLTTALSSTAQCGHILGQARPGSRKAAGPSWQRERTDWSTLSFAAIQPGHAGSLQGGEQLRKWHCCLLSRRPHCLNSSHARTAAVSLKVTAHLRAFHFLHFSRWEGREGAREEDSTAQPLVR